MHLKKVIPITTYISGLINGCVIHVVYIPNMNI